MADIKNESIQEKIPLMNMKLQTFRLKHNSKNPSSEWVKTNLPTQKRARSLEKMEMLKDEYNNFGVICGKANDLTIVDLDFYNHGDEKFDPRMSQFIQHFGEDFIKRFNTFSVRTGSGGYHLYFKYIQKIKQTSDKTSSIDIRNDGGYVVAPYSNINGNRYTLENLQDIQPMPQELVDWLLNNIYPAQKVKKARNPKVKVKKINPETKVEEEVEEDFDDIDLGVYKFAIPKKIVEECLCKGLPDKYFHDYAYWLKYTTAMKTLDMKPLWDKYNKIRCKKDKNKGNLENNWDGIVDYNKLDMLTHCLKESNVEGAEGILTYFKYKPTECHTILPHDFITRDKLGYTAVVEFKKDGTKILIFRSDTGTGKTTTVKHHLKETGSRFISIVSRISLGEEQTEVFRDHGIECNYHQELQDTIDKHNNECNGCFYNFKHFEEHEGDNIIITIDSLCKMEGFTDFYGYTIYLDEINSLIEHLITSPTCAKKRAPIFSLLRKIINEADLVIGTDADISDNCLEVFNQLNLPYRFIDNTYKHNNSVQATEITSFEKFMKKLRKEPKFIVCADSKTIVEILGHNVFNGGEIIYCLITSEGWKLYKGKTLIRILEKHERKMDLYDIVLYSPKIVYGLDSIMKRPVFAYFCQQTITPVAMVQQLCRCRDITYINFMFEPMSVRAYKYHDIDEIKDEVKALHKLSISAFDCVEGDLKNDYMDLYARFQYNYDCYDTNKKAHFMTILKNRGVKIAVSMLDEINTFGKDQGKKEINDMKLKDMKLLCENWLEKVVEPTRQKQYEEFMEEGLDEEDEEDIQEAVKETYEKYKDEAKDHYPEWIWRKNDILQLPYSELHEHMELFTKPAKLEAHFQVCNWFFKTNDALLTEIGESKDYGVNKIKSKKGQLILMNKFIDMTNKTYNKWEIPKESDLVPLTQEQSERYNIEYNLVYRIRRQKPIDLTDQHECFKHYTDLYRKVCVGLVDKTQTTKKGVNVVSYKLCKEHLEYHHKIMGYRKSLDPLSYEELASGKGDMICEMMGLH